MLSILTCCCPCIGPLLGAVGVVLGYLGMKKADQGLASNKQLALAGLITGGVGLALGLIITIWWFVNGANFQYWEQFQNQY